MKDLIESLIADGDFLGRIGNLNEAGLSRVVSHASKKAFAIVTAFRDGNSLKANRSRNKALLGTLKSLKAGAIQLVGHWAEAPYGMSYADAVKQGRTSDVQEESFFVPIPASMDFKEFEAAMTGLMKRFDQDAILLGHPDTGAWVKFKNGGTEKIGSLTVGKTAQAYSSMRKSGGKSVPFIFEGSSRPSGQAGHMAFTTLGLDWIG